jgi:hypothetical protein
MANTMRRSAVNGLMAGVSALLMLVACAGDDETPPGLYSEPCDMGTTCAQGLQCIEAYGICSQGCTRTADCRTNLMSSTSECVAGICQEPCIATQFMPCSNGLRCIQSSAGATCRDK